MKESSGNVSFDHSRVRRLADIDVLVFVVCAVLVWILLVLDRHNKRKTKQNRYVLIHAKRVCRGVMAYRPSPFCPTCMDFDSEANFIVWGYLGWKVHCCQVSLQILPFVQMFVACDLCGSSSINVLTHKKAWLELKHGAWSAKSKQLNSWDLWDPNSATLWGYDILFRCKQTHMDLLVCKCP